MGSTESLIHTSPAHLSVFRACCVSSPCLISLGSLGGSHVRLTSSHKADVRSGTTASGELAYAGLCQSLALWWP